MAQALGNISDMPEDILAGILLSLCVSTWVPYGSKTTDMIEVKKLSSVCTRWRDVLLSSCNRASWSLTANADLALQKLRSLKNVTHVTTRGASGSRNTGLLLRGLAEGFPRLTSFHLTVGGNNQDLEDLSLFLSFRTNIQELSLAFDNSYSLGCSRMCKDSYFRYYRRYLEALEAMDFAPQTHLKKLTLDWRSQSFPLKDLDGCCFPVSHTLAQVASLQELHIRVAHLAVPLPPWLAELPAFAGLRLRGDPGISVLDPEASMTQLRELSIQSSLVGTREMDAVSRMSHLTALELVAFQGPHTIESPLLRLSPTLRRLKLECHFVPRCVTPLPLLEELNLYVTTAIQPDYFAFTPGLRRLDLSLWKGVVWPRLDHHLTQLTSLALDFVSPKTRAMAPEEGPGEPVWCISRVYTPALQGLVLRSCRLLPIIGGLFALEGHLAVSLWCTCHVHTSYYDSHAEYAASQQGRPCQRLPPGDARQLFKDTRDTGKMPPMNPAPAAQTVAPAAGVRQMSEQEEVMEVSGRQPAAGATRSRWALWRSFGGGCFTTSHAPS
eukprot:jgi/Mesen1/5515/ME000279S04723